jgi:hypothetical protein
MSSEKNVGVAALWSAVALAQPKKLPQKNRR